MSTSVLLSHKLNVKRSALKTLWESFSLQMMSKRSTRWFLKNLFIFLCLNVCSANNYCRKSEGQCKAFVRLYVNRLNSERNLLPYEYHDFDFCPISEHDSPIGNLGQMVFGDRIHAGPYKIYFLEDIMCAKVCTRAYVKQNKESEKRLDALKKGIRSNYQHHWIVDNMPVTFCYHLGSNKKYCTIGFPFGTMSDPYGMNAIYNKPDHYYLFNHVDLTIVYTNDASGGSGGSQNVGRIISIEVQLNSINHQENNLDCTSNEPLAIPQNTENISINITYSYSVKFVLDNRVKWSSRWDHLLQSMGYSSTLDHWYSLFSSVVTVIFLSGAIARVLIKTYKTDHSQITNSQLIDAYPSSSTMLLSIFLGSGVQVFCTIVVTLALSSLGLLSPSNGGALMTCAILVYCIFGFAAGYISARIYKYFGGVKCRIHTLLTVTLCTGLVLGVFCILNLILLYKGSSGAVSINGINKLFALWLCVSMPLTLVGAHFGCKRTQLVQTLDEKQIPHLIPTAPICCRSIMRILCGGVLPFGCIFIQLFFILNSVWFDQFYNTFNFLFLTFCLFVMICSETTVLLCYFRLSVNDYRWQWESFFTSGCTAFYLFVYCCYYFVTKMSIEDFASTFLYFGYTLIMSYLFFLMAGTIGFMACFWFIHGKRRV